MGLLHRPDAEVVSTDSGSGEVDGLTVEALDDSDRGALRRLVALDPVTNVVLDARLASVPTLSPRRFGGSLLGARDAGGTLVAAAFHGGNLLPVGGDEASWRVLGERLATEIRLCTSIVGDADAVHALWPRLEPAWGAARAFRERQPLLRLDDAALLPDGDPAVMRVPTSALDAYLPAAAAMFTEELDISPFRDAQGEEYRRRIAGLIREGRAFARFDEHGEVVFKADFGAVTPATCQVQGVWVRPDLRGQGIGTRALAAVLREALRTAPTVSLYVNDFNEAARRMYDALGMRQVGTLSTVLF
ncbi:GNAT family N-acetyltransferase [Jatrophihabitans fulvus]